MHDIITLVVPWCGRDTIGGAENQARMLAYSLQKAGFAVEIWTTTARSAAQPAPGYYPAGVDQIDGVPARRFTPTAPHLDDLTPPLALRQRPDLLARLPAFPEHELRLLASLPGSDELLAAIAAEAQGRQFIFLPYPFPSSFWGSLLAGPRAWLILCLHDEPYARYSTTHYMVQQARGVLANSSGERALALRLFELDPARIVVAGEGIDLAPLGNAARFREQYRLHGPLLLYVGRRDPSKNTPLLLSYAREYWARRGGPLQLAIAGNAELNLPPALRELVLDLGVLSEQDKHDAYAAADLFINPSLLESFSIVLMEAWLQGTAALVHADCDVTRMAAQESGAGLAFADFGQFAAALDLLLARPDLRQTLGRRGREYVLQHCRWEDVARRTAAHVLV